MADCRYLERINGATQFNCVIAVESSGIQIDAGPFCQISLRNLFRMYITYL